MPDQGIDLTPSNETLTLMELKQLTRIFVSQCGVDKIRLTGGEPTLDSKLIPMLKHLDELRASGLKTICMTTNGMRLHNNSELYKSQGKSQQHQLH